MERNKLEKIIVIGTCCGVLALSMYSLAVHAKMSGCKTGVSKLIEEVLPELAEKVNTIDKMDELTTSYCELVLK